MTIEAETDFTSEQMMEKFADISQRLFDNSIETIGEFVHEEGEKCGYDNDQISTVSSIIVGAAAINAIRIAAYACHAIKAEASIGVLKEQMFKIIQEFPVEDYLKELQEQCPTGECVYGS
jgi:hypothetical protein